jgi:intergrase/recombinase
MLIYINFTFDFPYLENILDDNTKFERIDLTEKSNIYKETTRREDAVRTLINELKSNEIISEHLSKELNPIG